MPTRCVSALQSATLEPSRNCHETKPQPDPSLFLEYLLIVALAKAAMTLGLPLPGTALAVSGQMALRAALLALPGGSNHLLALHGRRARGPLLPSVRILQAAPSQQPSR